MLITDSSVINLLNNCHNIRSNEIDSYTNITEASIDAFIEIAKRNPKIKYSFYFGAKNELNFNIKNIDNEINSRDSQKCLQIPANFDFTKENS